MKTATHRKNRAARRAAHTDFCAARNREAGRSSSGRPAGRQRPSHHSRKYVARRTAEAIALAAEKMPAVTRAIENAGEAALDAAVAFDKTIQALVQDEGGSLMAETEAQILAENPGAQTPTEAEWVSMQEKAKKRKRSLVKVAEKAGWVLVGADARERTSWEVV